jgi:mRNA interferase MazF
VRAIHLAQVDKLRPVLILTRESIRPYLRRVTVAAITSKVRGLTTELPVGTENGLKGPSVVSLDNISTIPVSALGRHLGFLADDQEEALTAAIHRTFDLR